MILPSYLYQKRLKETDNNRYIKGGSYYEDKKLKGNHFNSIGSSSA